MNLYFHLFSSLCALAAAANPPSAPCASTSFEELRIEGTDIISIVAAEKRNFTHTSVPPGSINGGSYTIDFCEVTVTYTHAGWNDTINVNVWLPLEQWNKRLWALGGGGFSATFGPLYQTQAVAKGYAAIGTDSGHTSRLEDAESAEWALISPGNLNLPLVEDWGSRTLGEMTAIGKNITETFYKTDIAFSYFSGCSGGGRQAMMIAQRFPADYDGILAVSPAIDIESFVPAGYWTQQIMNTLKYYPLSCEVDAFTNEAVKACDELDGLKDGIISAPWLCKFSAHSMVGKKYNCNGTDHRLTQAGATVVQAAWDGPATNEGRSIWPGLQHDAVLSSVYAATSCTGDEKCGPANSELLTSWFRFLVAKDPTFDASQMSKKEFIALLHQSQTEFSNIGASDSDLSAFRDVGAKMIAWHGVADEVIPPKQSERYYDDVLQTDPQAGDYFKLFMAPGVGHCTGGVGPAPNGAFDQLVLWVENGTSPDELAASKKNDSRQLCPYPLVQRFIRTDADGQHVFGCKEKDDSVQLPRELRRQHPLHA